MTTSSSSELEWKIESWLRWMPISMRSSRRLLPREPSTIRIRQEGLHGEDVARIVAQVVAAGAAELQAGVVVTVRDGRIRCRKLPM